MFEWPVVGRIPPEGEFHALRQIGPPGVTEVHEAVDINAAEGTPVLASGDGEVTLVQLDGNEDGVGNSVCLKHGEDGEIQTQYHHLRDAPLVSERYAVKAGDLLGYVGQTGNAGGPHLCWQTLVRGTAWNPRQFVKTYGRQ